MRTFGRRLALIVSAALAVSLAANACDVSLPGSSKPTGLTAGDLKSAGAHLPSDQSQAADALVDQIFGGDEHLAQASVAEALRRSGFPLVSINGPVVAMPDHLVLVKDLVYIEMIPELTKGVRRDDYYSPAQMAELLNGVGLSADPLPADALIDALGLWAKDPGPLERQFAAATIRALSGRRGELLYANADLESLRMDPLQTFLVVGHATSPVGFRGTSQATPRPSGRLDGVLGITQAAAADPCAAGDGIEKLKKTPEGTGQVGDVIYDQGKDRLVDQIEERLKHAGHGSIAGGFKTGVEVEDKGADLLSVLLLLMGAQITLNDDHGGRTHYRHTPGDTSRNVKLTASARFDSNIAKEHIGCYKLAGIDVPESGPLEGFRVRWRLDQARDYIEAAGRRWTGDAKHLKVVSRDVRKLDASGGAGDVTGKDGQSHLELYPKTEDHPPAQGSKAVVMHGKVWVTAALDKDDFPLKLSHLIPKKGGSPAAYLFQNIYDLALGVLKRSGLPNAEDMITVDYHGNDIYIAKGDTPNVFLFFVNLPVYMDVYTCDGLAGQWKGGAGANVDPTVFGSIAAQIAGQTLTAQQYKNDDLRFQINPEGSYGSPFVITSFMKGMMYITNVPKPEDHLNGPVGSVDFNIGGQSLDALGGAEGGLFTTRYPVLGVESDSRCPENRAHFEND